MNDRDMDLTIAPPFRPELLLACVSSSPSSAAVIRETARAAGELGAGWIAAYVEAPDSHRAGPADGERLQSHLRLAEALGAETVRLSGPSVSKAVARCAAERGVTRIVAGKPSPVALIDRLRGSPMDRLLRGSGQVEIRFVGSAVEGSDRLHAPAKQRRDWKGYLLAVLFVTAATFLCFAASSWASQSDLIMTLLLAVLLTAFLSGRGPALVAATLSVASFDFFFVPPYFTFDVDDLRHIPTFAVMFAVGLATSGLTGRLKRQEHEARDREARTSTLYALERDLAAAVDETAAVAAIVSHAEGAFRCRAAFHDSVEAAGAPRGRVPVPIVTASSSFGILVLDAPAAENLDAEHGAFLSSFVLRSALALERLRLARSARAAEIKARAEETRSALLSSVSHDLRTPLASILGAGTALRDDPGRIDPERRAELQETICVEAERMDRLVANLLDMTRLESGTLEPRREWIPLEELVGSALTRHDNSIGPRKIIVDIPADLPLLPVDPVLFEQLLFNLIDNALKVAPPESPLEIRACVDVAPGDVRQGVVIEVADRGPGLAPGEETRIFEKFYRGSAAARSGIGLGLSICRGIVFAHGGAIEAENRQGGGALFRLRIPIAGMPPDAPAARGAFPENGDPAEGAG